MMPEADQHCRTVPSHFLVACLPQQLWWPFYLPKRKRGLQQVGR